MKALYALLIISLTGCAPPPVEVVQLAPASFVDYRLQTLADIQRNRHFQNPDHTLELAWNVPREWVPTQPNGRGALLVHGLGDSPGSFVDIATQLADQGYRVRTVLLPGHGTQPSDMLEVSLSEWRRTVEQQVGLLRKEVDHVYLGGFSTGANLVTDYAMDDQSIAGLLLFSPAFKSDVSFDWLLPLLARVKPWLRQPTSTAPQQTPLRYQNVPTNGFAQFYLSSAAVRNKLALREFDRPVLVVSAAHDSVVDVAFVRDTFNRRFSHPASRMIWYGNLASELQSPRLLVRSDLLAAEHISQFSHMGVLFSPDNPQYGRKGSQRLCWNGQSDAAYQQCLAGGPVWYSDWGYREADRVHARLTYNPYFAWQSEVMAQVMEAGTQEQSEVKNAQSSAPRR
ncbi:alpha/beta fold hydrolase [Pseudomonas corrugata]|uniref:Alpha/beta fold hydrolase n=1 Tax=Pseudomonas corrugata TaxID=47879 RepID=A0A7Y5Z132_9PSED|nr:alpha/beta fold hydrolase [Pseudomonas corrugata]NUT85085.1 alpha/beta fold hydrolase [Pseudomonas corrugata]